MSAINKIVFLTFSPYNDFSLHRKIHILSSYLLKRHICTSRQEILRSFPSTLVVFRKSQWERDDLVFWKYMLLKTIKLSHSSITEKWGL